MTRNNGKTAVLGLQRPFVVSLVSLLLFAGQPVLADDGFPLLPGQPGSTGNGLPLVLQPSFQKTTSQFNKSPRDATNGQINDNFEAIQQRLSEKAGRSVSPQETGAWIEKETGVPMTKRDLPLTGVEKATSQFMEKDKEELKKGKSYGGKQQVFTGSKSEDGDISLTTKDYKALTVEGSKKTSIGASRDTKLTSDGSETKNKLDLSVSGSASATAIKGEIKFRIINNDGTSYAVGSVEGTGPKFEGKVSAGSVGVDGKIGASALSATASGGVGVIKDNTYKEGSIEFGGNLGVGAELKILPNDGFKAKGNAGVSVGVKYQNGEFPKSDNFDLHQDLEEIHITPESYKILSLPNKSEPSELNGMLGDIEQANGETRGNETMFVPDPGSNPRLILIDGQYVPETPVPVNGSGILDTSNNSSSMSQSTDSDAPESNDKRQSMKDEFNRNKQQNQQAVAIRQAEQAAKAAEAQYSAQQQDFFSTMNNVIMNGVMTGSAAHTTPSPSMMGSNSASQPSNSSGVSCNPKSPGDYYCCTHYCGPK